MGRIGCNGRELEFEEHKEYQERPYQLASQRSRFCKTWCSRNLRHPNGNWISELMSNPWRSVDPLIMFNCKMQWRQTLCSQMRITIRALYGSLSLLAEMPCEARALAISVERISSTACSQTLIRDFVLEAQGNGLKNAHLVLCKNRSKRKQRFAPHMLQFSLEVVQV